MLREWCLLFKVTALTDFQVTTSIFLQTNGTGQGQDGTDRSVSERPKQQAKTISQFQKALLTL